MEIKLFGKSLFSASSSKADFLCQASFNQVKDSKYLPDFVSAAGNVYDSDVPYGWAVEEINNNKSKAVKKKGKEEKKTSGPTPKGVFDLKLLHDESFKLNVGEAYVDGQLTDFKKRLGLVKTEEYDMLRGTQEIASIVARMENRKKYGNHDSFYEQYPYTMPSRVAKVLKDNDHLKLGQVAQFVADMPKEAIEVMKAYEKETLELCDKKPVFYIIADKKDFKKSESRRDPILLAQSPFGHFWQILGAWDEEMLLLENL